MSHINFGFPQVGNHTAIFKKLTEEDQNIFYNYLPLICMGTGIGTLTPATIPHMVARLEKFFPGVYEDLQKTTREALEADGMEPPPRPGPEMVKQYLSRFIGYHTNVGFDTTAQFIRRMTQHLPVLTPRQISKFPWDMGTKAFEAREDFVPDSTAVAS